MTYLVIASPQIQAQLFKVCSRIEKLTLNLPTEQQVTILHESIISVRRTFVADLDDVEESTIEGIGMEDVLEYIERQRLTHMPHRGSHWDKVLKWAEFFAVQMSGYAAAIELFAPEGKAAARLIWIATQSLLSVSLASFTI